MDIGRPATHRPMLTRPGPKRLSLVAIGLLAGVACSSPAPSATTPPAVLDGGEDASAPPAPHRPRVDGSAPTLDAGAHEAASAAEATVADSAPESSAADSGPDALCITCIGQRGTANAQACAAAPACLDVVSCLTACQTLACDEACSSDATVIAQANDYLTARDGPCGLACTSPLPAGGSCRALGAMCDPLVPGYETCCASAGKCSPPTSQNIGTCCNTAGGACDPTQLGQCCEGTECTGGTCEKVTCVPSITQDCSPGDAPWDALPCCDARLACTALTGFGSNCCAPDGTSIDSADSDLCCSHAYDSSGGTCIAQP
jgi:hypothetical protein